jgi:hypothetical protein
VVFEEPFVELDEGFSVCVGEVDVGVGGGGLGFGGYDVLVVFFIVGEGDGLVG